MMIQKNKKWLLMVELLYRKSYSKKRNDKRRYNISPGSAGVGKVKRMRTAV
jgi:hypothetical protein